MLHMMHHMGYTYTDILRLRANTRTAHTVFRAEETARIGVSAGRNGVGGDDDGPKEKLATPRHASVMMTDRRTFHERGSRDTGVGAFGRIRAAGVQTQLRSCRTHYSSSCVRVERAVVWDLNYALMRSNQHQLQFS